MNSLKKINEKLSTDSFGKKKPTEINMIKKKYVQQLE